MTNKNAIVKVEKQLGIPQFRLVKDGEQKYGTSLKGYITTTFGALEKAFGAPHDSDGYKVSGEWCFHDDDGNEFTIYDWKRTSLYDSEYPTVSELRNSTKPDDFNIGGDSGDIAAFIKFLESKVKGAKGRSDRF